MSKSIVYAALLLALAPTAVSGQDCAKFGSKAKQCRKAGCAFTRVNNAKYKTCTNPIVTVADDAEDAEESVAPVTICASISGARKCRKDAACDWAKAAGEKRKSCVAATIDTNATDTTDVDVAGCTDATAINYDAAATIDDGSCNFVTCEQSCGCAVCYAACDKCEFGIKEGSCGGTCGECYGSDDCLPGPTVFEYTNYSGCCRENWKSVQPYEVENYMGMDLETADDKCEENCNANDNCTAYEVLSKKAKQGNRPTDRFRCELHDGEIDSASQASKSCKRATCHVKQV